jgi:hypothetical protein
VHGDRVAAACLGSAAFADDRDFGGCELTDAAGRDRATVSFLGGLYGRQLLAIHLILYLLLPGGWKGIQKIIEISN